MSIFVIFVMIHKLLPNKYMCTVTLIPQPNNGFILTSNRDESPNRVSTPPDFYNFKASRLLFPKDERSGGTWIGVSDKNRVVCVLNGAFIAHKHLDNYRMSRGVIAKHVLTLDDLLKELNNFRLDSIEPFTMVIVDFKKDLKFYELVWDGQEKHFIELPLAPKLWSSSTLYDAEMKNQRQAWFCDFLNNRQASETDILSFHKTAGTKNLHFGVVMDRGFVKTTSISQIIKAESKLTMRYNDLQSQQLVLKQIDYPIPYHG